MPTYVNSTNDPITIPSRTGFDTWQPGEYKEVDYFISSEVGLDLDDYYPYTVPVQIMMSGVLEMYDEMEEYIEIPNCEIFLITIICKNNGKIQIQENKYSSGNDIIVECDKYAMFRGSFKRMDVEGFRIKCIGDPDSTEDTKVSYLVSRIK
jgi:hypothetical protein